MPAPVGPTSAAIVPASTVRSTPRSTGVPGTYANDTPRNSTCPGPADSAAGAAGSAAMRSSSSSSKMRSMPAIPDWMLAQRTEMERIGMKKRRTYCTNATSTPIVTRSRPSRKPPQSSTTAMAITASTSRVGANAAVIVSAFTLASRLAALARRNAPALSRSRPNACISRTPTMLRSRCELTTPIVCRVRRKATRALREKYQVNNIITGSTVKLTRAMRQLNASIAIRMPITCRKLCSMRTAPMRSTRSITLVSLAMRDSRSPACTESK